MTIDSESANLVDQDGIGVTKDDSDDIAYLAQGGDSVPAHIAPENTYYYRVNGEIYRQTTSPSGTTWDLQASATGEDHHSGWDNIISGQTVTVSSRKQMRVSGDLQNSGILINNGIVVVD